MLKSISGGSCARVATFAAFLFLLAAPSIANAQFQTIRYANSTSSSYVLKNIGGIIYEAPYVSGDTSELFAVVKSALNGYYMIQSKVDGRCLQTVGGQVYTQPCTQSSYQLLKLTLDPWTSSMPPELRVYPYQISWNSYCFKMESYLVSRTDACGYQYEFFFGSGSQPLAL